VAFLYLLLDVLICSHVLLIDLLAILLRHV